MISLGKLKILIPLQKLPKNVRDLGKLIVAKGLKKLPKVQKIAQSGHTACINNSLFTRGGNDFKRPNIKEKRGQEYFSLSERLGRLFP